MARQATIIGMAVDLWGDQWDVREERPTDHGFAVRLGWPQGVPRGRARGAGGVKVIITADLAAYMDRHKMRPDTMSLPIGATAIKRIRRLIGHHWQIDRAAWWAERAPDLVDLTIEAFAARHCVSVGAVVNARHALFGPALRPAGWWRAPDVASVITSGAPIAAIADSLGLSVITARKLRLALADDNNRAHADTPAKRYDPEYYEKNKERFKESYSKWYKNNREKILKQKKYNNRYNKLKRSKIKSKNKVNTEKSDNPIKPEEFVNWQEKLNLRAVEISAFFGVTRATVYNYRNKGVPVGSYEKIKAAMDELAGQKEKQPNTIDDPGDDINVVIEDDILN